MDTGTGGGLPTKAEETAFVRPFMLTGGRTVGDGGNLPVETMVLARLDRVDPVRTSAHAAVLSLCVVTLSIAEVAAHLRLPLGVARVLVADLTATGHLERFETALSDDVLTVRRLLDGIRAL